MRKQQSGITGLGAVTAGSLAKFGAIGIALVVALLLTLNAAEASGDPYADAFSATGNIDGTLDNVTGPAAVGLLLPIVDIHHRQLIRDHRLIA